MFFCHCANKILFKLFKFKDCETHIMPYHYSCSSDKSCNPVKKNIYFANCSKFDSTILKTSHLNNRNNIFIHLEQCIILLPLYSIIYNILCSIWGKVVCFNCLKMIFLGKEIASSTKVTDLW